MFDRLKFKVSKTFLASSQHYKLNISLKTRENTVAGKKWWSRVFFDLIDRSIYNNFMLEQESPHHRKRNNFCSQRKRGRPSDEHLLATHVERHFPDFLPANEKGKRKRKEVL